MFLKKLCFWKKDKKTEIEADGTEETDSSSIPPPENPLCPVLDKKRINDIFENSRRTDKNGLRYDWSSRQINHKNLIIRKTVDSNRGYLYNQYEIFIKTTRTFIKDGHGVMAETVEIKIGTDTKWIVNGPWVSGLDKYLSKMEKEIEDYDKAEKQKEIDLLKAARKAF